ncbi:oxidoreductase [Coniella lustricola]|uniref:Oxidoreductase n=1 Tax=Coniella lustricola TaxID=2025994 RepID=A0A2T3AL32_9PEZI|nr:oxidoreductase [Coniella lustricola]
MAPSIKVLIIGGGISGPALAFWLNKLNDQNNNYRISTTIVERSPDLRAAGQQIDIRGQGLTALRRMGLEPAVRSKLVDERGFRIVDEQGTVKAFFAANKSGQGKQGFSAEFEIMRGDLVRILYDATRQDNGDDGSGKGSEHKTRYLFGTSVESFEQREDGNGVQVRFSDGNQEDFDLVVGADGQGSRTRRAMLGETGKDTNSFKWLNLYVSYFTVPKTDQDDNCLTSLLLPRRRVVTTRVDNAKTMQAYLGVLDPKSELHEMEDALASGDMDRQKRVYAELFKDGGWVTPRIIDGMLHSPEANNFYAQKIGQVKIDKYSKGRVVLLGDAGYCPSPITGVGTSVGLVGAYVLAGEIAKHLAHDARPSSGSLDTALKSYDTVLRPFIQKAQKLIPGIPDVIYPETAWGVWFCNLIFQAVSWLQLNRILQRFMSDDFAGGWKIPDYPELKYDSSEAPQH